MALDPVVENKARYLASGDYATEAGTQLLIESGLADRGGFVSSEGEIDWVRVVEARGMSSGERKVCRVAASLHGQRQHDGGEPRDPWFDLGDQLTGIDMHYKELILVAVQHAMGFRRSGWVRAERPVGPGW